MRNTLIFTLVLLSSIAGALSACTAPAVNTSSAPPTPSTTPLPLQKETPQAITTEELVGFLELDASPPPDQNAAHGAEPKVGWVFLNGRLVGKMPFQQRRMLVPGTYEVRVVLANEGPSGVSFWTVSWPQIKIERGRTQIIRTQKVIDDWLLNSDKEEALVYHQWNATMVMPVNVMLNGDTERRLAVAAEELTKAAESFEKSDEWKAISAAAEHLRLSPPSRPRVWIDLPPYLGGARELDADQLSLLAKHITPNLGGWLTHGVLIDATNPPSEDEQLRLRAMIGELTSRSRRMHQYVTNVFDEMIATLNKVQEG